MQNFLLVDDDKVFHLLGIRALQRIGFTNDQIQTALNGKEAMEILNSPGSKLPDIILLDLNMPIMNGFEFLEVFRTLSVEKRNSAKIVVLSSSNNPVDIARAMKLGATQYLTKPLTEDMLSGVLLNGNERTEAA
jgi:CheY-like chemotaxis protein